ncbi:ribbon-helix-helix protein, CopG family [Clostridium akagii]|uniref:ribbon-helix-helix protein, CopG family n=1 Tax=Clostridium akagii TaxID=91623 RepID=UPI000478696D|nr:ribbon-helix-helix protein, CopG family [Clostridium akagii]
MDIIIRNLDVKSVAKLDEMAKKKGISRQEFLKNYIETLSVLDTIRENDNRYIDLVNQMAFVIKENTNVLSQIRIDFILED